MKYLKIQNDGILDIRLVALMGGTTKSKDEYKIGQFGTGLKYTLAFLFRHNIAFKIYSGTEEIEIRLDEEIIRDEKFEIICINGHRTSITTKMGEDWKAWMIIREIWCNALDEGNATREITQDTEGKEGTTTFYIQVESMVQSVLDEWDKYFIHGKPPISSSQLYDIYPGGDKLRIYKNGVLIDQHNEPALFSYDIKTAHINELREFKGYRPYEIAHALADANEKAIAYFLENITEKFYEGNTLSYDQYQTWGETWKTVLGSAKLIHQKAIDNMAARGIEVGNDVTLIKVPEAVYRALTKQFSGIGALVIATKAGEFYESYNMHAEDKIKQGITILEACAYPMHPELQFIYGYFEDKTIEARINRTEKKIYISNTFMQKPLVETIAMLIEENEHFNTGMSDCSRQFQQHWINLYTRELLAKNKIEI